MQQIQSRLNEGTDTGKCRYPLPPSLPSGRDSRKDDITSTKIYRIVEKSFQSLRVRLNVRNPKPGSFGVSVVPMSIAKRLFRLDNDVRVAKITEQYVLSRAGSGKTGGYRPGTVAVLRPPCWGRQCARSTSVLLLNDCVVLPAGTIIF